MKRLRKLGEGSAKGHPWAVAFSPDGACVATLGSNKRMTLVPAGGGKARGVSGAASGPLAFSPDGARIVLGEMTTSLFDVGTLEKRWTIKSNAATAAAFSPDGRWVAIGSTNEGLRVHDAKTGKVRHALGGPGVRDLAFAADGKSLFSATSIARVQRYDTSSWECVAESERLAPEHALDATLETLSLCRSAPIVAVAGRTFACERSIRILAADDLSQQRALLVGDPPVEGAMALHDGWVRAVRFLGSATRLAALFRPAQGAPELEVFEAQTAERLAREVPEGAPIGMDVSPDGSEIALVGADGIAIWSL